MLYIAIIIFILAVVVRLYSWIEELHMKSFENKINEEIKELKEGKE